MKNNLAIKALCLIQLFLLMALGANAQSPSTISGKVVDDQSKAVWGATVLVKGTTNGVVTGQDGSFTLNVGA